MTDKPPERRPQSCGTTALALLVGKLLVLRVRHSCHSTRHALHNVDSGCSSDSSRASMRPSSGIKLARLQEIPKCCVHGRIARFVGGCNPKTIRVDRLFTFAGGYYFQPALTPSGSSKWVIHLQGGGEYCCVFADYCLQPLPFQASAQRSRSATRGSADHYPPANIFQKSWG